MSTAPIPHRRHALVTGGGRGIGRAIAVALTAAGYGVTITGRDAATLDAAVAAGVAAGRFAVDATDAPAMAIALEAAALAHGPIEVLVTNAGTAETAPFARTDAAMLGRMLAQHVVAPSETIRAVLPGMVQRGFGRVVVVASSASMRGSAFTVAYTAAKHGALGLVRALAVEVAMTGVTVNAVCPSYTETGLITDAVARRAEKAAREGKTHVTAEAQIAALVASIPQKRLMQPEEVAAAVVYLASEAAAGVTGQALAIDGGLTA